MSRVDPLEGLKNFEPKASAGHKSKQESAALEELASEHGFVARPSVPLKVPADRSKRRFTTGRNIQINIKGDQATKDELYRLADEIDAPLGETLKRALTALERELSQLRDQEK
jgi:hypothetical protein